jgi:RHS repeat-associated protein
VAQDFKPDAGAFDMPPNIATGYHVQHARTQTGLLKQTQVSAVNPDATLLTIGYGYDPLGRLTSVRTADPGALATVAGGAVYDAHDRLIQLTLANGLVGQWTYSRETDRLETLQYATAGSDPLTQLRYVYDDNDNPTSELHRRLGQVVLRKDHVYDSLDRLSQTDVTTGTTTSRTQYQYTNHGNLLRAGNDQYRYDAPSPDAVSSLATQGGPERTFVYDDDGLLARENRRNTNGTNVVREFSYTAAGIVSAFTSRDVDAQGTVRRTTTTTIFTDEQGQRLARQTRGAGAVSTVISLPGIGELRLEDRAFVARFAIGTMPVAEEWRALADGSRRAESRVLLTDLRDSVIATATMSDAAAYAEGTEYDAWGRRVAIGALKPPLHAFVGIEPDQDGDVYQLGPRLYDASLRRFLSPDPLMLFSPSRAISEGVALNLFAYARNNPVTLIDADGLDGKRGAKQPKDTKDKSLSDDDYILIRNMDNHDAQRFKELRARGMTQAGAAVEVEEERAQAERELSERQEARVSEQLDHAQDQRDFARMQETRIKAIHEAHLKETWGEALVRQVKELPSIIQRDAARLKEQIFGKEEKAKTDQGKADQKEQEKKDKEKKDQDK